MCVVVPDIETYRNIRKLSKQVLQNLQLNINLRKTYTQPVRHGVRFCGRFIYVDRIHVLNRTIHSCKQHIQKALNNVKLENAYKLLSSYNSYSGIMCHTASFNIQCRLAKMIQDSDYKQWLYFQYQKNKVVCKMYKQFKRNIIRKNELSELHNKQKEYEQHYKRQYRKSRNTKKTKYR